ncbi:MAG: diguanylate cyclase [Candidatus Tectomicrobia bacterium]|uniref:Diguanylate cyclase n=1 Tax=Tectimicrobiota bacterium TaxID=2528274 RepID=A0A932MML5_UNCTE|nr:diguanylate cyclase [Candidatus Tectomicrobia bacterium]
MHCGTSPAWVNLIDAESGLYNRLHLVHFLTEAFARARRYGGPLACALFRATWWRGLEEMRELPAGAVRSLGRFLLLGVREGDILGRWSEGEFLLVAPSTGREGARACLEKILGRLDAAPPALAEGWAVSLRAGEAGLPEDAERLRYPEDLPLLAHDRLVASR